MRRGRKPRGDKGPNHVLRQEREMRGWSQSRLAELIGANPNMISRWECGERGVDYIYQEKLCQLFEKNAIELGFMKEPETQEKALSEISATNLIVSATFESETEDKLDYAENLINLAWAAWFASRPKEAAHSVNRLLSNLEKTAYSLYQPGHTSRAKKLTIRAHGLLGAICLDAMQNETALFHYMQAHRFAEEIHDVNLSATYLCLIGDVLRRQNDQSGALKYMENARNSASNASNTTKGHILQLLAYTYGDTGQEAAFERAISEATDLLAFSGEGIDTTQEEFIPFEIYEIRGKVNRDLGKPLNAIPYLELAEKSLNAADSVTPRWHALLEISRVQAFCDAGDITNGIELSCKGFIMAYQCHSPRQMNRIRKLLRKLEKSSFKNHPRVQDLKNLLYETYMRMNSEDLPANPLRSLP